MKSVKATPGAKRLIESLRNMGYECNTAIADLIDNSIAAGASEIHVEIFSQQGSRPPAIVIADNGRGMDRDAMHEAMRFGTFQEYSADDLGKYGLGLKTASLSQCRTLTVSSKPKALRDKRPRRNHMRWDIDYVYGTDDWDLLAPSADELERWEAEALNHDVARDNGTVVLWTGLEEALPLLSAHEVRAREKFLATLIDEVSEHLRMVFHRFMQGAVRGRRKLNLYVCGEKLEPWDPFCRDEKTRELEIVSLPVNVPRADGSERVENVTVSPFILPREDEFSSREAWKGASGIRNWNQQQGFYFYRNNRLLQGGGWSWLRAVDEHTKLLRVAVDFSSDLDRAFAINITKMKARIPAEIRDRVDSQVSTWAKTARERYDRKPSGGRSQTARTSANGATTEARRGSETPPRVTVGPLVFLQNNAPGLRLTIAAGSKGQIKVLVPRNHELASAIFSARTGDSSELRKLCVAAISVLEAVYERRMQVDRIPIAALKKALLRQL
ncbi:MAG: ATP-binding protein [Acidobacteriota bacterium]|nr:ATP-binding protein [Acidobacteriota bacterium]